MFRSLIASFLILNASVTAATTDQQYRDKAGEYFRQGNYREAVKELEEIKSPTIDDLTTISELCLLLRDFSEALKKANEALQIDSSNINVLQVKSLIYVAQDDRDSAVVTLQKALVCQPHDKKLLVFLGYIYLSLVGRSPEDSIRYLLQAERCINSALEVDSTDFSCLEALGSIRKWQGRYKEAETIFKSLAVPNNPGLYSVMGNLGELYLNWGKYELAEKELRAAIEINYRNADAHRNLAKVYVKLGKKEAALKEFRITLQLMKATFYGGQGMIRSVEEEMKELENSK